MWIEHPAAAATADAANAAYGLMLCLMAHAYALAGPSPEKAFAVEAAIGLMKAVTLLGERAARLPAGPANPGCHAGVSFTALRDASALPPGAGARRFFVERFAELADGARALGVRGNLEITTGAGRMVARTQGARLCRCGGSGTKPFCDGTHARIGFRSA